jgi:hypothetical protein
MTSQRTGGTVGKILTGVVVVIGVAIIGFYALMAWGMKGWAEAYDAGSTRQVRADPPQPDVAPGYERDRAIGGGGDPEHALPDGAAERVQATLADLPWEPDTARAEEAAKNAATAAFSEPVVVQAEQAENELVVTVAVPEARDCVVVVRPADGEPFQFSDFDRILLEPGEGGCGPYLYLRPIKTH